MGFIFSSPILYFLIEGAFLCQNITSTLYPLSSFCMSSITCRVTSKHINPLLFFFFFPCCPHKSPSLGTRSSLSWTNLRKRYIPQEKSEAYSSARSQRTGTFFFFSQFNQNHRCSSLCFQDSQRFVDFFFLFFCWVNFSTYSRHPSPSIAALLSVNHDISSKVEISADELLKGL